MCLVNGIQAYIITTGYIREFARAPFVACCSKLPRVDTSSNGGKYGKTPSLSIPSKYLRSPSLFCLRFANPQNSKSADAENHANAICSGGDKQSVVGEAPRDLTDSVELVMLLFGVHSNFSLPTYYCVKHACNELV